MMQFLKIETTAHGCVSMAQIIKLIDEIIELNGANHP